MNKRLERGTWMAVVLLTAMAGGLSVWAAEPEAASEPASGEPAELNAALQGYFQKRLRVEVGLSDEQSERILPLARELVEARRNAQRTRAESVRLLRRGLEQGASDAELEEQLARLDRAEIEHGERDRSIMREIDEGLSIRQRVQLRFFMQRFRREMQDRIHELRKDLGPGEVPPRRAPRREAP